MAESFDRSCRFYVDGLHWRLSDHETDRMALRDTQRRKANKFTVGQAIAAGANAFLHGAQDGQKFMGVHVRAFLQQSC